MPQARATRGTSSIVVMLVAVLGLVAVLPSLGYPAPSLVAGLGIGGLALALAAQWRICSVRSRSVLIKQSGTSFAFATTTVHLAANGAAIAPVGAGNE